jgi:hypothetical protein
MHSDSIPTLAGGGVTAAGADTDDSGGRGVLAHAGAVGLSARAVLTDISLRFYFLGRSNRCHCVRSTVWFVGVVPRVTLNVFYGNRRVRLSHRRDVKCRVGLELSLSV